MLEKYNINWIIFAANSMLSRILITNDEWRLIYADKIANHFVIKLPEYLKDKGVKPLLESKRAIN